MTARWKICRFRTYVYMTFFHYFDEGNRPVKNGRFLVYPLYECIQFINTDIFTL